MCFVNTEFFVTSGDAGDNKGIQGIKGVKGDVNRRWQDMFRGWQGNKGVTEDDRGQSDWKVHQSHECEKSTCSDL